MSNDGTYIIRVLELGTRHNTASTAEGARLITSNSYQILVNVCNQCNSLNCACDYDNNDISLSSTVLHVNNERIKQSFPCINVCQARV